MEEQQVTTPQDVTPEQGQPVQEPTLDEKILAKFGLGETEETPQENQPAEQPETEGYVEEPVETEFELKHNGELKKVPLTEAQRLAQMGYDYEFKMQRLNNDAAQIKQMAQAVQAREQLQAQKFDALVELRTVERHLQQYQNVDWVAKGRDDPIGAFQERMQYDQLVNLWQAAKAKVDQADQPLQQATRQVSEAERALELQKLMDKVPEWKDTGVREKETRDIVQALMNEYGYAQNEIRGPALEDHRFLTILRDAVKYRQSLSGLKNKQQQIQGLPKVAKPGVRQPPRSQAQSLGDIKRGLRQVTSKEARRSLEDRLIEQKFGLK